jgi:hypothetical protein
VEEYLKGKSPLEDNLAQAHEVMNETVRFRTSAKRATAEYRYILGGYLLVDVICKAWKRAEEVRKDD